MSVWRNMCTDPNRTILHASAVCLNRQGVLILGPSGSGKSGLALELLALGADLICDDRVELRIEDNFLFLCSVDVLAGQIEARGFGILSAAQTAMARCALVVDLSQAATSRLPKSVTRPVCGVETPYLLAKGNAHAAAIIVQYLKGGLVT